MKAVLALVLLALFGAVSPALAAPDCLSLMRAAVKTAPAHDYATAKIPLECWRLGPLRLGMTRAQVEAILGPPDSTGTGKGMWGGEGFTVPMVSYTFRTDPPSKPENPAALGPSFALELAYQEDRLVSIEEAATGFPTCSTLLPTGQPKKSMVSPYQFYGIGLGMDIKAAAEKIGSPSRSNGGDHFMYWPVLPLDFLVNPDHRVAELHWNDWIWKIGFASDLRYTGLEIADRCAAEQR
jgi:hypothetical protein